MYVLNGVKIKMMNDKEEEKIKEKKEKGERDK